LWTKHQDIPWRKIVDGLEKILKNMIKKANKLKGKNHKYLGGKFGK
jgi:hypothetical protein